MFARAQSRQFLIYYFFEKTLGYRSDSGVGKIPLGKESEIGLWGQSDLPHLSLMASCDDYDLDIDNKHTDDCPLGVVELSFIKRDLWTRVAVRTRRFAVVELSRIIPSRSLR